MGTCVLAHLGGHVGLDKGLLCVVMVRVAFGNLGVHHRGWPLAAKHFYTQKKEDPLRNKGVLVSNHSRASVLFLQVGAPLTEDTVKLLARRWEEARGQLGAVFLLTPLVLGALFVSCLYGDEC